MSDETLARQIAQLRTQLTTVDAQLVRSGSVPGGLEDLKEAVDNMRTNVWAVLSASKSKDYPAFIARFRMRRGIDILKQIAADLDSESGRRALPEFSEMQIIMQQVQEKMAKARSLAG